MPGDIHVERLDYLQQYASFLGNVRDSSLTNFRELENLVDYERDNLHMIVQKLDAKREDAKKVLDKAHELQEQMNYSDAQSNQKLCAFMESIDEVYQKLVREVELCEENIKSNSLSLECLQENKNAFDKTITELIDKDIDVVKRSIDTIARYISVK